MCEYWETYVGPEYVIENNQAALLNFTMTCFLFGAGIPILFPISLLCLIVLYLFEKKTIARLVRIPKNFDPQMNEEIISMFLYGPIFYSAIGYWMYSNPQVIGNKVFPIKSLRESVYPGHNITEAFTTITPGTPYLIMLVFSILVKLDHHLKIKKKLCTKSKL